jgi:deaminated glutathione amidase
MRAAAVQLTSSPDPDRNLETADRLTREAAGRGAELVVLPEKWSVYGRPEDIVAGAQPLDGPALRWARGAARELGIDLVAGSIAERVDGGPASPAGTGTQPASPAGTGTQPASPAGTGPRGANTCVHVGPDGEDRAVYRKIHMFDVEVGGRVYRESEIEAPGDEPVLTETADGTQVGLSICYDLRFPELYRILAVRGAKILTVPAAFTLATTREHWEVLLRARAIEDQCFVVAANQVGDPVPGLQTGGRSMIVDPWGVVLAQAPDTECVVVADLDFDRLADVRAKVPSLANRQAHAYRWPDAVGAAEAYA